MININTQILIFDKMLALKKNHFIITEIHPTDPTPFSIHIITIPSRLYVSYQFHFMNLACLALKQIVNGNNTTIACNICEIAIYFYIRMCIYVEMFLTELIFLHYILCYAAIVLSEKKRKKIFFL